MTNGLNLNVSSNKPSADDNAATTRASFQSQRPETNMNQTKQSAPFSYSPFQYGNNLGLGTFGQRIHADGGSEVFNKVVEQMTKFVEEAKADSAIDIIPFAKEIHKTLSYSVIVVARNNTARLAPNAPQHNYITAQVLILEASGEILRPYDAGRDTRRPYTVTPTTELAFNSLLTNYLTEQLKAGKYANNDATITFIDPIVLRRENTADLTNPERVRALTDASTTAVETRAQVRMPGFQDYNFVQGVGGNDVILPVSVDIVPETQVDLTGRLFHSDARVTVSAEQQSNRNNGPLVLNGARDSRDICTTHVGIDLVPVDPSLLDDNRTRGRGSRDRFEAEVAWAPRLNARLINQYLTRTPSGMMFAIASMAELARDRAWAQSFRQSRGGKGGQNLRDIGYLNIEANLTGAEGRYGEPLNTRASDFTDHALGIFLDGTVSRYPILSVDCMTSGVQAYTTTGLYLAARGSKANAARANAELMHSMNCATNGELEKLIDLDTPVVIGEGDLVHVGTWLDNDTKMRDLFELDNYLAMAVIGGLNNPGLATEWVDTYLNTRNSEEQNMSERLQQLQSAASGSVNVTGTALRVEVNGEVVQAFVDAMGNGKLPLVPRTGEGDLFTTTRAVRTDAGRALYKGQGFGRSSVREGGRGNSRYAADRY